MGASYHFWGYDTVQFHAVFDDSRFLIHLRPLGLLLRPCTPPPTHQYVIWFFGYEISFHLNFRSPTFLRLALQARIKIPTFLMERYVCIMSGCDLSTLRHDLQSGNRRRRPAPVAKIDSSNSFNLNLTST